MEKQSKRERENRSQWEGEERRAERSVHSISWGFSSLSLRIVSSSLEVKVDFNSVNHSGRLPVTKSHSLDGERLLQNEGSVFELCHHLSVASSFISE